MVVHPNETDHSSWVNDLLEKEPLLLEKMQAVQTTDKLDGQLLLRDILRFLHLIAFYDRKLTPSLPVDWGWHEFILFTRLYATFCHDKFSRFIHHHPGGKEDENQRNFQKTLQLYYLHWGQPNEKLWGSLATTMFEGTQCGSCLGNTQDS